MGQNYSFEGRLTRDPELRTTPNGTKVANVRVAVPNEKKDDTTFVDVTFWGGAAEFLVEWFSQGKPIVVWRSRLKNSEWDDKTTGEKRSKLEVDTWDRPSFVVGGKSEEGGEVEEEVKPTTAKKPKSSAKSGKSPKPTPTEEFESDEDEDDDPIPF